MAKRTTKTSGQIIELPAIPLFPYQTTDVTPPVGILLLLDIEGSFVLGEWNGVAFVDSNYVLVEKAYGPVSWWCIVLNHEQNVVLMDIEE